MADKVLEQLQQAAQLYDRGHLDQQQFNHLKNLILQGRQQTLAPPHGDDSTFAPASSFAAEQPQHTPPPGTRALISPDMRLVEEACRAAGLEWSSEKARRCGLVGLVSHSDPKGAIARVVFSDGKAATYPSAVLAEVQGEHLFPSSSRLGSGGLRKVPSPKQTLQRLAESVNGMIADNCGEASDVDLLRAAAQAAKSDPSLFSELRGILTDEQFRLVRGAPPSMATCAAPECGMMERRLAAEEVGADSAPLNLQPHRDDSALLRPAASPFSPTAIYLRSFCRSLSDITTEWKYILLACKAHVKSLASTEAAERNRYVYGGVNAGMQSPSVDDLALSLAVLRLVRWLCGVAPSDTVLATELMARCQHGAALLAMTSSRCHTPPKPVAMANATYSYALQGTNGSAIVWARAPHVSLTTHMCALIDDSSRMCEPATNRRWALSPGLHDVGLGWASQETGSVALMYVFGATQDDELMADFVSFPAPGPWPVELFHKDTVWSCQLHPARFRVRSDWTAAIYPILLNHTDSTYHRTGSSYTLDRKELSMGQYGMAPCLLFQPVGLVVEHGHAFEVEIQGIECAPVVVPPKVKPRGAEVKQDMFVEKNNTSITLHNTSHNRQFSGKFTVLEHGQPKQYTVSAQPSESVEFSEERPIMSNTFATGPPSKEWMDWKAQSSSNSPLTLSYLVQFVTAELDVESFVW